MPKECTVTFSIAAWNTIAKALAARDFYCQDQVEKCLDDHNNAAAGIWSIRAAFAAKLRQDLINQVGPDIFLNPASE